MGRVKIGIGGAVMLGAALLCERGELILIFLLAAVLHEAGHLAAARLLGIGVERMEFGFSGVRICVDGHHRSYFSELILALCGPLANIVSVGGVLLWAICADVSMGDIFESGTAFMENGVGSMDGILGFFALASIAQAAINLLPVRSLDGGRILHCTFALIFGDDAAERALTVGTALSAFLLWTVALYLMLKVAAGLSVFVFAVCIFFSCKS